MSSTENADHVVTIYSREACHLCDEVEAIVESVVAQINASVAVEEVDIDADEELREAYGERVPYVFVDGTPTFKYRVDEDRLAELLTAEAPTG